MEQAHSHNVGTGSRKKSCSKCKVEQSLADFYPDSRASDGARSECKKCLIAASSLWKKQNPERHAQHGAEWREENPDRMKELQSSSKRKGLYGLTEDDYQAMLASQGHACALCGRPSSDQKRRLSVDHDHRCCPTARSCGACVRALLCDRCNIGLGYFKDSPELLQKAIDYITTWEPK